MFLQFNAPINVTPRGGVQARGGDLTNFKLNILIKFPRVGNERSIKSVKKKNPTPGENELKEHFKNTSLLNVSSVKLLAVIKYFLAPPASLILNNKITLGRLTVLL